MKQTPDGEKESEFRGVQWERDGREKEKEGDSSFLFRRCLMLVREEMRTYVVLFVEARKNFSRAPDLNNPEYASGTLIALSGRRRHGVFVNLSRNWRS